MRAEIRAKILEIFQEQRENPHLAFEEERILDFLRVKAIPPGSIRNTMRGLKAYNKFMEALQMEFAICFRIADKQVSYSLEALVDRVIEMQENPRSSKAALRFQARQSLPWKFFSMIHLIGGFLSFFFFQKNWWLFALIVLGGLLYLDVWSFWNHREEKQYYAKLAERVLEKK
ncbi:MAG: hypothetical protein AAF696_21945 [Bacteroidota bacterium]